MLTVKAKIKAEYYKIVKLKTYDSSYFLGKTSFSDDSSRNMFVFQPVRDSLELKKDKGTDYILNRKSKG